MNFLWGIEVEAAIYAKSALVSMSQQPEYVAQITDDIKKPLYLITLRFMYT